MTSPLNQEWHREIGIGGFYDFGGHIVLLPCASEDLDEHVAHETTHAKIVANSSLGYLRQFAEAMTTQGYSDGDATLISGATQLAAVLDRECRAVHESSAWLVSELVSGGQVRMPADYRPMGDRLRTALNSMPDRPYRLIEDCRDDYDPLFRAPVHLIQAAASYALSPPFVSELTSTSAASLVDRAKAALRLSSQNPTRRFEVLIDQLSATPYPQAMQWVQWVRSWFFETSTAEPDLLRRGPWWRRAPKLAQSGFFRSDVGDQALLQLAVQMTGRPLSQMGDDIARTGHFTRLLPFEPHVHPYYQTCIAEVPTLETPYDLGENDPLDGPILEIADYAIVSDTEEENMTVRQGPVGDLIIRFESPPGTALFWRADFQKARAFLQRWSALGKAVLTTSTCYDYAKGDWRGGQLFKALPHAIVAITDLRSLLLRMLVGHPDDSDEERTIVIGAFLSENPDYGFLVLQPNVDAPVVVVLPCLAGLIPMLSGAEEELRLPTNVRLQLVDGVEMEALVKLAGPVIPAALRALADLFSP